jgi:hypothetical protein
MLQGDIATKHETAAMSERRNCLQKAFDVVDYSLQDLSVRFERRHTGGLSNFSIDLLFSIMSV